MNHTIKDYMHVGCYTADEFNESLLAQRGALMFAGMKTEPETRKRKDLTQSKDVEQDCFITFK